MGYTNACKRAAEEWHRRESGTTHDEMPAPANDDWRPQIFGQEERLERTRAAS